MIAPARIASRWVAASLGLAIAPLQAQQTIPATEPGSGAATVDSLVADALQRAPAIAAQRERIVAALDRADAAGSFESPMVEGFLQNASYDNWTVGDEEMSMLGVELSQALPWPGKRGARRRAAEADVGVANAELQALERRTAVAIQAGYAHLYAIDQTSAALHAGRDLLALLRQAVAARYSTGETGMGAQVEAQLAVANVDERLAAIDAERSNVVTDLNTWLGRPAGSSFATVRSLPPVPRVDPGVDVAVQAPDTHVLQASAVAAVERAESERLEQRSDWVVAAGYGNRGGLDPIVTLRLETALPLWGGRRARRQAAAHDAAAAQQALRAGEIAVRAEAERLQADAVRAAAQMKLYRDAIVPQSQLAFETARTEYAAGRGDLAAVVRGLDRWYEARVQLASREAEHYVATARYAALATPLPPAPPAAKEESR